MLLIDKSLTDRDHGYITLDVSSVVIYEDLDCVARGGARTSSGACSAGYLARV